MQSHGAELMGGIMKVIAVLPLVVVLALGACAPKPAANAAVASAAAINGPADCASDGLKPGTEAYNDCVSSLADANNAAAADPSTMQADAAKQRAQMKADMDQQRASMQADMNSAMAGGQNPAGGAGCKTTTDANNNVTTQCP
jgi:hypothetical protein